MTVESIVAEFRRVAREHGYAIGEHGSRKRDLDLIACPWTKDAHAASTLIRALSKVDGVILKKTPSRIVPGDPRWPERFPRPRPHGRLTWVFLLVGPKKPPYYIDLSVMPRAK